MPALGSRHTEAGVVTESILVHGPTVVRAGSTPIVICLTESSSITSRADTECSGSLWQELPCWQRFASTGMQWQFPRYPSVPRRTLAQEAPFPWDIQSHGNSLAEAGEARVF